MIQLLYILILFFIFLFLLTFIFNIIFYYKKSIIKENKNVYRIILLTSQILNSIGILTTFILILYNFTELVEQLIVCCSIIVYIILYIFNIIGYNLIKF